MKSQKPEEQPRKKGGFFSWMYTEEKVEETTNAVFETDTTGTDAESHNEGGSQPIVCDPKDVEKLFGICVLPNSNLDKFMKVFDSLSEYITEKSKLIQAVFKTNPDIDGPGLILEIDNNHLVKLETEKQSFEADLADLLRKDTSSKEKQIRDLGKEISDAEALILQKEKEITDLKSENDKRSQNQKKLESEIASRKKELSDKKAGFYLAYEAVKGRFLKIKELLN